MQIFVLRHGQAEPEQTTDEARNLTEKGRSDVASTIRNSYSELSCVSQIWTSPLVRAQQSAYVARDILFADARIPIKTTELISPESDPFELFALLQNANIHSVLLASHQPFVGKFLDIFCGQPRGTSSMDTSSLALVECDIAAPDCGELRWLKHLYV